jgi:PKD repeat protein
MDDLHAASFYTMRHLTLLFVFWVLSYSLPAQQFDNNWFLGYDNDSDTTDLFGVANISFTNGFFNLKQEPNTTADYWLSNVIISDSTGNLVLYCDGRNMYNANNTIIENGDSIVVGGVSLFYNFPQTCLLLPYPAQHKKYILLHQFVNYEPTLEGFSDGVFYSIVDMNANQGQGKVTQKHKPLLQDTIRIGHMTATKHANGRDWWILVNRLDNNQFIRLLLDPTGVHEVGRQFVGENRREGFGQTIFSPDGSIYCSYHDISVDLGGYIDIHDFDRCTGLLSNPRRLHKERGWGGLAISPNNRYLYHSSSRYLYRYDLTAPDIFATQELLSEWDGLEDPFPTGFFLMTLAPNNKIYVMTVTTSRKTHVIHAPDNEDNCQAVQHGIQLPIHTDATVPNNPNFRLGPVDGSSCDTLGLNNMPIAWFRYERDTTNPNLIRFIDLSYYEPATWAWSFGNGATSTDRFTAYDYPTHGPYEVCLTVTNQNGSHTFCRTIDGITSTQVLDNQIDISVTPNPFHNHLSIALTTHLASPVVRLYDLTGRMVLESSLQTGTTDLDTEALPAGAYIWQVSTREGVVKSGKAIKLK